MKTLAQGASVLVRSKWAGGLNERFLNGGRVGAAGNDSTAGRSDARDWFIQFSRAALRWLAEMTEPSKGSADDERMTNPLSWIATRRDL